MKCEAIYRVRHNVIFEMYARELADVQKVVEAFRYTKFRAQSDRMVILFPEYAAAVKGL